jgi:uncharacterized protein YbaR (Trm112 family)
LQIALTKRKATVIPGFIKWLLVVTLGVSEALFTDEEMQMAKGTNEALADLLLCCSCETKLTIDRDQAPAFYLEETLACPKCKQEQQVPLFWLMTILNIAADIVDEREA